MGKGKLYGENVSNGFWILAVASHNAQDDIGDYFDSLS